MASEREWYVEYIPARFGRLYDQHLPTFVADRSKQETEWCRPSHIKIIPDVSADRYNLQQPVTLEACVQWISQYEEIHRENMRFVHAETGETIPGITIAGWIRPTK